jgi:hypothetical protein
VSKIIGTHVRDLAWLRARVEIDPETNCWIWKLKRNIWGYGRYNFRTPAGIKSAAAHRLGLELALDRPIRSGLSALHHCDNPPCCNGEHLFEGTQAENALDCLTKGRWVDTGGELNGQAKLTHDDIQAILAAILGGEKQRAVAKRYGVNEAQISRIKNGKAWR